IPKKGCTKKLLGGMYISVSFFNTEIVSRETPTSSSVLAMPHLGWFYLALPAYLQENQLGQNGLLYMFSEGLKSVLFQNFPKDKKVTLLLLVLRYSFLE